MAEINYDRRGCILNLNRAGVEELSKIPEIGELAQKIADYRNEHGPFKNLDDLDSVPGVGEEIKEALRNKVRFELGDGVCKAPL